MLFVQISKHVSSQIFCDQDLIKSCTFTGKAQKKNIPRTAIIGLGAFQVQKTSKHGRIFHPVLLQRITSYLGLSTHQEYHHVT